MWALNHAVKLVNHSDRMETLMTNSIMADIAKKYRDTHESLLKLVAGLTDEQMGWTPNATTPSIGFHVWHIARWADYLQEQINGRGSQLWEREGVAANWGLETSGLGFAEAGTTLDGKVVMPLRFPGRYALLDYTRQALAAAQQAVGSIDDSQYYRHYDDIHRSEWSRSIGPTIVIFMKHDSRHLGMIECLIGAQGLPGSADD
jgi:hypothetical protein